MSSQTDTVDPNGAAETIDATDAIQAGLSAQIHIARALNAKLRATPGMSQRKVAKATGIKMTTFGYCIRGERAFDIDQLARIAHVLDVNLAALITYAEHTEGVVA